MPPTGSVYGAREIRHGTLRGKEVDIIIDGRRCLIGNNHGGINGWPDPDAIYRVATVIELVRLASRTHSAWPAPRHCLWAASANHRYEPARRLARQCASQTAR